MLRAAVLLRVDLPVIHARKEQHPVVFSAPLTPRIVLCCMDARGRVAPSCVAGDDEGRDGSHHRTYLSRNLRTASLTVSLRSSARFLTASQSASGTRITRDFIGFLTMRPS